MLNINSSLSLLFAIQYGTPVRYAPKDNKDTNVYFDLFMMGSLLVRFFFLCSVGTYCMLCRTLERYITPSIN